MPDSTLTNQQAMFQLIKNTIAETRSALADAEGDPPAEAVETVKDLLASVKSATGSMKILTSLVDAVRQYNGSTGIVNAEKLADKITKANLLCNEAEIALGNKKYVAAMDAVAAAIIVIEEGSVVAESQKSEDKPSMSEILGAPGCMFILRRTRRRQV